MHAFSIGESVRFGWHMVKAHSGLVFKVVLTLLFFQIASSAVEQALHDTLLGGIASVAFAVVGVILSAGMTIIFLRLARHEHAQYAQIIPDLKIAWRYFCSSLLSGVITMLPLMAGGLVSIILLSFAHPAGSAGGIQALDLAAAVIMLAGLAGTVYFAARYAFARIAALDGARAAESLRKSTELSAGIRWRLILFFLALLGLNILGLLALIVGLLVTVPISLFAFVHAYTRVLARHH